MSQLLPPTQWRAPRRPVRRGAVFLVEKAKVLQRGPYIKHHSDEERRAAIRKSSYKYYETHKEICKARNQAYAKRPEVIARTKARWLMPRALEKRFDEVRSDSSGENLS